MFCVHLQSTVSCKITELFLAFFFIIKVHQCQFEHQSGLLISPIQTSLSLFLICWSFNLPIPLKWCYLREYPFSCFSWCVCFGRSAWLSFIPLVLPSQYHDTTQTHLITHTLLQARARVCVCITDSKLSILTLVWGCAQESWVKTVFLSAYKFLKS